MYATFIFNRSIHVEFSLKLLPVAAFGDRGLAAKQQHVMHCVHAGMRGEIH